MAAVACTLRKSAALAASALGFLAKLPLLDVKRSARDGAFERARSSVDRDLKDDGVRDPPSSETQRCTGPARCAFVRAAIISIALLHGPSSLHHVGLSDLN